jgi:hypothetical protein
VRSLICGVVLLCLVPLSGCSGFAIGVRQDKEDQATFGRSLIGKPPGREFPARALFGGSWTRLWVFRGGAGTQPIEDRIGIPFPRSDIATPTGAVYLVLDDGKQVRSAFTFLGPERVDAGCLLATHGPLTPRTALQLVPGRRPGSVRLTAVATASRCR